MSFRLSTGDIAQRFRVTMCPQCGCPPQYVLGTFYVRVNIYTGKKESVGKPRGDEHLFECGGKHQWPAEKEKP